MNSIFDFAYWNYAIIPMKEICIKNGIPASDCKSWFSFLFFFFYVIPKYALELCNSNKEICIKNGIPATDLKHWSSFFLFLKLILLKNHKDKLKCIGLYPISFIQIAKLLSLRKKHGSYSANCILFILSHILWMFNNTFWD